MLSELPGELVQLKRMIRRMLERSNPKRKLMKRKLKQRKMMMIWTICSGMMMKMMKQPRKP